jgi:hypothetical protein
MYARVNSVINMPGLNRGLFPVPLSFSDALQRAPALARAEALQGTSPLVHECLVTPRSVAGMIEKNVL